MTNDFKNPRMSVNHNRMNRISRSSAVRTTKERTSSSICPSPRVLGVSPDGSPAAFLSDDCAVTNALRVTQSFPEDVDDHVASAIMGLERGSLLADETRSGRSWCRAHSDLVDGWLREL